MPCFKKTFIKVFAFAFFLAQNLEIDAQSCSGSWAIGTSLNYGCFFGKWIGQFNSNLEPPGCPINPIYTAGQTNTFTFDSPVSSFAIDFYSFTTAAGCGRMEIMINGIFYPLTVANLFDIPIGAICPGSISFITVSNDGYITSTNNSQSSSNGRGRIIINGINASSVTISTNDPAGTIVSAPFACTVVPLKLISFNGYSISCNTQLNWESGIEQNVKNIEIQKSEDGMTFYKVGEVIPKGTNSKYTFITSNISEAFFRLKINDIDNYYEFSEIRYVKSACVNNNTITPNPSSGNIEIIGLKNTDKLILSDMLGKVVMRLNTPINNKLNIQSMRSGMYILQIFSANTRKASLKLIKN